MVINVALIVLVFASLDNTGLDVYFNSDTLYLPSIYKDLFIDQTGICGWHFNPAPNFFPDMIIYFIIRFLAGDFLYASFVFSLVQYLGFTVLIYVLNKTLLERPHFLSLTLVNLLLSLVFLVSIKDNDVVFTAYLLLNSYHMGAFILALMSYILAFIYLRYNKKKYLIWIAIIGFLGIISDKLFIILYVFPTLLWVVFLNFPHYKKAVTPLVILSLATTVFSLAGLWIIARLACFTIETPHSMFAVNNIPEALDIFLDQTTNYLSGFNFKTLIIGIALFALVLSLVWLIRFLRKGGKRGGLHDHDIKGSPVIIFHFLVCTFIPLVLIAPVLNGNYTGYDSLRYNIYAYLFGLLSFGYLIGTMDLKKTRLIRVSFILGEILLVSFILVTAGRLKDRRLKNFFAYYPEKVRIIDSLAAEKELEYGLANYWDAKQITMFSKQDVRVYAVFDDLIPYYHVTNTNWFYGRKGRYDQPVFTFILPGNFSSLEHIPSEIMMHSESSDEQGLLILKVAGLKYKKGSLEPLLTIVPEME